MAARFVFAVENTQRVTGESVFARIAQFIFVSGEIFHEFLAVNRPALFTAYGVNDDFKIFESESPEKLNAQRYYFSVSHRPGDSEKFRVNLVELSVASLLRSFVAEHRPPAP